MKYPTLYAPKRFEVYLEEHCLGSAGPDPNITGMRKKFYGDAPLVKCGRYVYRVTHDDYNIIKNGGFFCD